MILLEYEAFHCSENYSQESKSEPCQDVPLLDRALGGHIPARPPGLGMTCDLGLLNIVITSGFLGKLHCGSLRRSRWCCSPSA